MDEGKVATPLLPEWKRQGLVESIWLRTHVHDGVVQMVATMWMMVTLATMITYAGVVGDEHGDDDGAGTGDDREW